jgi:hypothetical protein
MDLNSEDLPVLVISFNRPDQLKRQLRFLQSQHVRVYVVQDISEKDDVINLARVQECTEVISEFSSTIYKCLIFSTPQKCFRAVSSGISWVFEIEDRLVILEDDVLVTSDFLAFAEINLTRFKDDLSIGGISALNLVPPKKLSNSHFDLRLSVFTSSWGWATWRDRWDLFIPEIDVTKIDESNIPFASRTVRSQWCRTFRDSYTNVIDSWAYKWQYSNWANRLLTVVPSKNMALNLGFGEDATHTKDITPPWWLPTELEVNRFNLESPYPKLDRVADRWMLRNHYRLDVLNITKQKLTRNFPCIYLVYISFRQRIGSSIPHFFVIR